MKEKELSKRRARLAVVLAGVAVGWLCWNGGGISRAQTAPANLSPGLQEVVKLTQAHMADDVIVAYIKNSGAAYTLSANDILYLNSQGVSQPVISTLLQTKSAADLNPPPAAPEPISPPTQQANYAPPAAPQNFAPPPAAAPEINFNYFHDQLAPYGSWINMPGYGWCFHPADASVPGWRPYCDRGHWVYTDDGWFWQSDYAWGEIAFHYGRWNYNLSYGWLWVPAYDYAPAWVCWRHAEAEGFCGWAPLPPGAEFRAGVGLLFNGRVALDIDFGLNQTYFTFVAYDHFWEHDCRRYVVPRDRVAYFYRSSVIRNNYRVENGRFYNEGLGHERIAALTHREVRAERVTMHDARIERHIEERRGPAERGRVVGHEVKTGGNEFDRRNADEHGGKIETERRPGEDNFHNSYPASKGGLQEGTRGKTPSNGKQNPTGGNKTESPNKGGDPK